MRKDQIEAAVRDAVRQAIVPIQADIIRKQWPADGIVYVRLYTDDGREEWVLLDADCAYEKAIAMLRTPVDRLEGNNAHGDEDECGGGVCGVR